MNEEPVQSEEAEASSEVGTNRAGLIKGKLGVNAFKEVGNFHIHIRPGVESDPMLKAMARICPADLYHIQDDGTVAVSEDGCLECGTCLIVCGDKVLDWKYPDAQCGVQYRLS